MVRDASTLEEPCYHAVMKEAAAPLAKQPGTSTRKARTKKHIVTPGTVEQISRGVGVTKRDIALVTKVLSELGYVRDEKSGAPIRPRRGSENRKS
ncbi:MAG TPA: hypothetical protein VF173_21460 [Thermoanaerobaculia bacterium]|nr:hypothetical protein [Thermoanaerobaculia bacterium]